MLLQEDNFQSFNSVGVWEQEKGYAKMLRVEGEGDKRNLPPSFPSISRNAERGRAQLSILLTTRKREWVAEMEIFEIYYCLPSSSTQRLTPRFLLIGFSYWVAPCRPPNVTSKPLNGSLSTKCVASDNGFSPIAIIPWFSDLCRIGPLPPSPWIRCAF